MGSQFIILLDGDCLRNSCPPEFIENSFGSLKPRNICIRFAMQEVENWLIADRDNLSNFLNVPRNRFPEGGDMILNAKECIVNACRASRSREVQLDIVPAEGHTAPIGPAYNARLSEFIRSHWDLEQARLRSESLDKACTEIASL